MWGNPFSPYAEFSRVLGNELEEIPEQIAQLNLGDAELGWLPTEMHGIAIGYDWWVSHPRPRLPIRWSTDWLCLNMEESQTRFSRPRTRTSIRILSLDGGSSKGVYTLGVLTDSRSLKVG
jgi:hypothetical protein